MVNDVNAIHESEWIYSTVLSRISNLRQINHSIHHLARVPHIVEFPIFLCGYAFNPVIVPFWMALVYQLTMSPSSSITNDYKTTTTIIPLQQQQPVKYTIFYLSSVLLVLIFTEISKSSFATTRPEKLLVAEGTKHNLSLFLRRYGSLVSSLKSKHSFPSGDCAQAANVCLFLYRYVPVVSFLSSTTTTTQTNDDGGGVEQLRDIFLFGLFLPGVCFARVFYRCHWIEDCFGGIILSSILHWLLIPHLKDVIFHLVEKILF
mmetsp:Transcript_10331/g.14500  ORF Transcript_10331/g.14500 Transcript_10331/m.14500 type:complete len:261 (-) Transcript_10331:66-848(-)